MFLHHYLYRLKCIIRDKETMFWTFLFPILLATLFNLAFSNISTVSSFTSVKLGIVDNTEYQENMIFKRAIHSISPSNQSKESTGLFDIKYTSKTKADKLLEENKIEGYIYFNNGMKLIVKESGINQMIIKSFLDSFKQSSSTMGRIINNNPDSLNNSSLEDNFKRSNYLKEVPSSRAAPNNIVTFFYSLIGMASLYGAYLGLKEVIELQANLSNKGARISVAPTHKLKLIGASISAAITVQLLNISILLVYLTLILKIDFGNQLGYIVLTCIIGSITGVTFGTSITSVIKRGEGFKIGVLTTSIMTMSFLAGLMVQDIKYIISTNIPILGYLNPVNLITDSLYALYYYDTYTQFFSNISILSLFIVVFSTITYLSLRRLKYASL